jgi:hypothetical protein
MKTQTLIQKVLIGLGLFMGLMCLSAFLQLNP